MMSTVRSTVRGTAQSATAANTAPVHEFRCLYTHDLRRKQKRWQDGFLKFHTFNKRVMVYDQPRNYIGDTHWKGGDTLDDGDELTLENGVIVQVAEPVAVTQTDLTELLQKKPRDAQQQPAPMNVRLPALGSVRLPTPGVRTAGLTANAAPRHRPLSQLLGTPKGPHGRAIISTRSPFDERQDKLQKADEWAANERAAKRRRVAEAEQTRSAVKGVRTPVPKGREQHVQGRTPERRELFCQSTPLTSKAGYNPPGELIDLISDAEELEPGSDVTMPNTPPGIVRPVVRSRGKKVVTPQVPTTTLPTSSPPVNTTSRLVRIQEDFELMEETIAGTGEQPGEEEPPKRSKKLRLASGPRPKMLLCQDAEPNRRPTAQERRPQNGAAQKPQRNKFVTNEQNQQSLGRPQHPSDIRKLQNGLTQSSPPEPERCVPPLDGNTEVQNQDAPIPAELNNTLAPQGIVKQDKGPTQPFTKRLPATGSTSNRHKPDLRIQAIQAQEGQNPLAQSRRALSENDKTKRPSAASESFDESRQPGQEKLKERLAPQRPLQRSISLNVAVNRGLDREMTPPSPVADTDVGPWSTEALDLFDWRPPGYVFRGQGKGFGPAENETVDNAIAS
ncbi:uncharacterized protein BKCO1_13000156 [Diplodia corticola]|uniref:5'-3' DNA helicase ZGRF1-like N-terminal domain-containing protein n=1 Tax=Diplodia corticola TaxID=236234 RepID=A0A1J9S6C7_9PEZI|nr:uncharacterized protein BKCO1_13000156 [Diplodia corticola]OJD36079.1 hypothetical protein BKCO1_13000156 [Diplodia corticola]